jgi:hypothetical protein
MWFEGTCLPAQFPSVLASAMTTSTFWTNISSNVGTTINDDGYVMCSTGSRGTDNIYIRFENAFYDSANWFYGQLFSITEQYTPSSTSGVNGTFHSNTRSETLVYSDVDDTFGDGTKQNIKIDYKISVLADRVIIMVDNRKRTTFQSSTGAIRNLMYLGLFERFYDELDSSACIIAATNANLNKTNNGLQVLRTMSRYTDQFASTQNQTGWSSGLLVYNPNMGVTNPSRVECVRELYVYVNSSLSKEMIRGRLIGIYNGGLNYQYSTTYKKNNLPDFGYIKINGEDYFSFAKNLLNQGGFVNNIAHGDTYVEQYVVKKQ